MTWTVLHVITGLNAGGAERMLTRVATHDLGTAGPRQVVVSLMDEGPYASALHAAGIEVHTLGMRRARPSVTALIRLVRILRRVRPDVVMSWLYHADLLTTLAAPLAGNPPVIWNLRCSSLDFPRHPAMTRRVVSILSRLSGRPVAVAANSEAGRLAHEALGYTPRRWVHLPNGFDVDVWRPDEMDRKRVRGELGLEEADIAIVMVARIDPEKDHATFLAAAESVAERCPAARFVLIGRDTSSLATPASLGGRMVALGERSDVERLLRGMDISVLCSHSEGFPNVVGEAMASGLPCVVSDVGDSADIVGETGLVCPPRDPAALAAAIERLADAGRTEISERGRAARQRIVDRFSLDGIAEQYRALWESASR
jgi:glycosyltransferase involved in cell wall biosynthesis